MQKVFFYFVTVSTLLLSLSRGTNAQNITEFCSTRPTGLYCNTENIYQKIECPAGTFYTCPNYPQEFCQERGILREYGYKGGIARCVPYLNPAAVASFCQPKKKGVYCWGDSAGNLRVQCPSGIIYKCRSNVTDINGLYCNQQYSTYATCDPVSGGGGGAGFLTNSSVPVTIISTITETSTQVLTNTVISTVTLSPSVIISTVVSEYANTLVDFFTRTIVQTDYFTQVFTTPVPFTVTPTDCPIASFCSTTSSAVGSNSTIFITTSSSHLRTAFPQSLGPAGSNLPNDNGNGGGFGVGSLIDSPSIATAFASITASSIVPTSVSSVDNISSPAPFSMSSTVVTDPSTNPTETSSPVTYGPSCAENATLNAPAGSKFTYGYTKTAMAEADVAAACASMGGREAYLSSSYEFWFIGLQVCEPVWYRTWEGNSYDETGVSTLDDSSSTETRACLALYPGGASAVPVNSCQQILYGLCKYG